MNVESSSFNKTMLIFPSHTVLIYLDVLILSHYLYIIFIILT
jgi:hypothetical protein